MTQRSRLRSSIVFAAAIGGVGIAGATLAWSPLEAAAQIPSRHAVTLRVDGTSRALETKARTVGQLLADRDIRVSSSDYVYPALDVALTDGAVVTYRTPVPVTIVVDRQTLHVASAAQSIAELLEDRRIALGANDVVTPALSSTVPPDGTVRVVRVRIWQKQSESRIARETVYRLDTRTSERAHVVQRGRDGVRVRVVTFAQRDGGAVGRVVSSYVAVAPVARVIDDSLGPHGAYGDLSSYVLAHFGIIARSKVLMVATAYTPYCTGCSGRTAMGLRAGPGIVAVDPHVIPLGSRLYIPGYGFALAGDTGRDIRGDRVDLGFASYGAAIRFGRREVTVYRLK